MTFHKGQRIYWKAGIQEVAATVLGQTDATLDQYIILVDGYEDSKTANGDDLRPIPDSPLPDGTKTLLLQANKAYAMLVYLNPGHWINEAEAARIRTELSKYMGVEIRVIVCLPSTGADFIEVPK